MEHPQDVHTDLLGFAATLLTGHRRRLFGAEVCQRLCDGPFDSAQGYWLALQDFAGRRNHRQCRGLPRCGASRLRRRARRFRRLLRLFLRRRDRPCSTSNVDRARPSRGGRRLGEVVVGYLEVVLLRHRHRVPEPRAHDVDREPLGQLRLA